MAQARAELYALGDSEPAADFAPAASQENAPAVQAEVPPPAPAARPEPEVEATPIPHVPQVIASFAAPPATYQVVSEHDKVAEEESHRPVRRRRHEGAAPAPAEPLQLVETASTSVAPPPVMEEEAHRRPVRRRRHQAASAAPAEPLQLVETAPGAAISEGAPPQA